MARLAWCNDDRIFFGIEKWPLGLYLSSGAAGSAYGTASLITLLPWVYYSSQILLFGAEFTQVYADRAGRGLEPAEYAVRVIPRKLRACNKSLKLTLC